MIRKEYIIDMLNTLKIYRFYNEYHLGDCVLHLYLCRKLVSVHNVMIHFYVKPEYLNELRFHIIGYEEQIILYDISFKPTDSINCWIGSENYYFNDINSYDINNFYIRWFRYLCKKIDIECCIDSMLCDYDEIQRNIPTDSWDILCINSMGFSNGFGDNSHSFRNVLNQLSPTYKILTTQKLEKFECTRDYDWNLIQIAGASTKCKYVIANHTSPIHMCFNKWSIDNIKQWFIVDIRNTFSFTDNINIIKNTQQFNEIYSFFKKGDDI